MDALVPNGINWIVAIQSLGSWLDAPMVFFSFLGTENFFLLALPLIYWCIDASLGIRVGFILLTSVYLNGIFKLWFAGPRPYWVSDSQRLAFRQVTRKMQLECGASLHRAVANAGPGGWQSRWLSS